MQSEDITEDEVGMLDVEAIIEDEVGMLDELSVSKADEITIVRNDRIARIKLNDWMLTKYLTIEDYAINREEIFHIHLLADENYQFYRDNCNFRGTRCDQYASIRQDLAIMRSRISMRVKRLGDQLYKEKKNTR